MLIQVGSTPSSPLNPTQLLSGCGVHAAFALQPAVLLFHIQQAAALICC